MREQKEKKRKDKGRECKRTEKTWGSVSYYVSKEGEGYR
jgi:hypothetical protein